jgi:hypothetical protein
MSEAVVPSWAGVRETRWARIRRVDVRLVIAVLIGLVSVTGAVMTWRSSKLGEKATDKDRQAVAETVLQEQSNANIETQVRNEAHAFEQYKEDLNNAQLLKQEGDSLENQSFFIEADQARDQARELQQAAATLADNTFSLDYVQTDDTSKLPTAFLIDKRRADLRRADEQAAQLHPDQTVQQAQDLRSRSQRLEAWTILLVLSVVLLTIATIIRSDRARIWIASSAVIIFLVAASVAFLGD